MQLAVVYVVLLELLLDRGAEDSCQASEFNRDGDYLVGGLFPLHIQHKQFRQIRPVAILCDQDSFSFPGYQMLQVMRFAIEEINNSTSILPNVTLGYQIFDHCSDAHNFPAILNFFSHGSSITVTKDYKRHVPKVIGFTGPFSSTESLTIAPLFMMDLIPMVNYGAGSSILSDKLVYPSFVRTIPSNKDEISLIVHIIKHFGWSWVAFIGSTSAYSENGYQLFLELTNNTGICLAYRELLANTSKLATVFRSIDSLRVNVIVLFTARLFAEEIINSALRLNFQDKVWIASDSWAMNQQLLKEKDIKTIGTVIGVTPTVVALPGFKEFVYQSHHRGDSDVTDKGTCNQECANCSSVRPEDVINENPTYSFPIYSAVYTMAMALHNALQCNQSGCNASHPVYPYMLLNEIRRLYFPLNHMNVIYNKKLDPPAAYSIVLWDTTQYPAVIKEIGTYSNQPHTEFSIADELIDWPGSSEVPFSNCSVECNPGSYRVQDSIQHHCCFSCKESPRNHYTNYSADPYSYLPCTEFDWSNPGSTTCQKRSVQYLHYDDAISIVLLLSASLLLLLCVGVAVLFFLRRNTPVVRSAGGSTCYLMLSCIAASTVSVFFHFGKPTAISCALQNWIALLFYTICMSCLFVRSLQIIVIFKMASHLPRAHALWVKYSGQWLVVAAVSLLQMFACTMFMATDRSLPMRDTETFNDQILFTCSSGSVVFMGFGVFLLAIISALCFCFSYMGTDLPKNYNEARGIAFSVLMFFLSWAVYLTASYSTSSDVAYVVKVVTDLCRLYSIMFAYFMPKCFIIIFQPLRNTQEYFQASIQSYTQTISRM